MSLATHRNALVALWAAVPDVGKVHAYARHSREESKFRELYVYDVAPGKKQLRGWQLSNVAIREVEMAVGSWVNEFTWHLRGYMALDDSEATEITFDDLIEVGRAMFRADTSLGGVSTAEPLTEDDGVQKLDAGPVLFCGVLCHSALLQIKTREYL